MFPCPACRQVAFANGRCAACGYSAGQVRVVTGQPASPPAAANAPAPPVLPLDALTPLPDAGGGDSPGMEGFEPTRLQATLPRPPRAAAPVEFAYAKCPGCGAEQPSPPPMFCDGCGHRLRHKTRGKATAVETKKSCRDCGLENEPHMASCVNCGFKL